jgi:L-ascorbate metabolism protein UlaG (beta-lactamase superfamily)
VFPALLGKPAVRVVPVHRNTWPLIVQDAAAWAQRVRKETSAEPIVLEPGGKITL